MDVMIKKIEVTEHIDLLLYEGSNESGGCYISIKHSAKMMNMEGEVIVTPSDVPKLMQALASAAIELSSRGYYNLGFEDAAAKKKPNTTDYIMGWHATEQGAKELAEASAKSKKRIAYIRSLNLGKQE